MATKKTKGPKFPAFDKRGILDYAIEEMVMSHEGSDLEMVRKLRRKHYDNKTIQRIFAFFGCNISVEWLLANN